MSSTDTRAVRVDWSLDRGRIDAELARLARDASDLPPALAEPIAYALSTRGKRLRPILCAAAYRVASGRAAETSDAVVRLGCAIEIVHTYSLVHDDLPCMDDDDLRRGRPTVHRVFGVPRAVLGGASLLPIAVHTLLDGARALGLEPRVGATLVRELCAAAGAEGMVGGQLLDLLAEGREVDGSDLEAIHRAKTGALLTASIRIGAIAGGADAATLSALTAYGTALGLAFQITDDVLDVASETGALGKTAGRDRALSKASYPSLHGVDGARALARARVEEAIEALAGLDAPELVCLASYVVERDR